MDEDEEEEEDQAAHSVRSQMRAATAKQGPSLEREHRAPCVQVNRTNNRILILLHMFETMWRGRWEGSGGHNEVVWA